MHKVPHPDAVVFGVDIGKKLFHVVGLNASGEVVQRAKFRRETLLAFFASAEKQLVGMEACPGSQWLARRLIAFGHDAKIIPARFVKPYVKSNKNDLVDAEAIAEAVTRPTMRFVTVRSTEQVDLQAMHRIRDRLIRTRTGLMNQVRAFCLEYGLPMRRGPGAFHIDIRKHLENADNELSGTMRRLLFDLLEDLDALERRIKAASKEIETLANQQDETKRLLSIPGIGPLGATAILAAAGSAKQFVRARDMAAWLGLTPAEYSTGGKQVLLGISKRGNSYVRRLLIHGARSCLMHLDRTSHALGRWISELEKRMHPNKVIVALANKLARIAWAILTKPGNSYVRTRGAAA